MVSVGSVQPVHLPTSRAPRRRLRRSRTVGLLVAAGTGLLVVLSGCTTTTVGSGSPAAGFASPVPTASPTASADVSAISFADCSTLIDPTSAGISPGRARNLTFECGKLAVPQSYDQPNGSKISVFVLKVHDKRAVDPKLLFVNPGGPGASGVLLAVSLAGSLDDTMLSTFDIVGFDPRGVGLSSPLACSNDATKDAAFAAFPDVRTPVGAAQAAALYQPFVTGCVKKYGAGLADYNTIETAKDLELLRRSTGDQPLNYLGYSYGTRLGAVYANLYPTAIRTAVLDGAIDPTASDMANNENQVAGFEQAFDQFAADCVTRTACNAIGPARAAVAGLVTSATASGGIPSSKTSDPRKATAGLILAGVGQALYDQSLWPTLGSAILAAQRGDGKELLALADEYYQRSADGTYTNLWDAFTAVTCNDFRQPIDAALVTQTAVDWTTKYPLFGLYFASQLYQCVGWPTSGHAVPNTVPATGSKPIVVVGTVHDPATPYAGAGALAGSLGTGVLLSWDGEGHTAYGGKSPCVDKLINAYFETVAVPTPNTTCPAK